MAQEDRWRWGWRPLSEQKLELQFCPSAGGLNGGDLHQDVGQGFDGSDFGEPLPSLTATFLRIRPAWCVVAMAIMILALIAKELLIPRRRVRAWTSVGFAAAAGVAFLIYIVAMFRPLVGFTGGLGR